MKTAMQELIEYVDSIWSNGGWEETIKEKAKELLEKEKEQVVNAYNQNITGFDKLEQEEIGLNWAEDYYNQTYNQNK
jgi:hypothetical protein